MHQLRGDQEFELEEPPRPSFWSRIMNCFKKKRTECPIDIENLERVGVMNIKERMPRLFKFQGKAKRNRDYNWANFSTVFEEDEETSSVRGPKQRCTRKCTRKCTRNCKFYVYSSIFGCVVFVAVLMIKLYA